MTLRAAVKNRLSCADCPHAFKDEWTKKREALRCGNPVRGEAFKYVVQLYLKENGPSDTLPAPAWCPRRKGGAKA